MIEFELAEDDYPVIKVVGVGEAGIRVIEQGSNSGLKEVEYFAVDTSSAILRKSTIPAKVLLGKKVAKGRGTGGDSSLGQRAAIESESLIAGELAGSKLVFIVVGLGGGTGTGASPVIADICKERDILSVALVTRPFSFEGAKRVQQAKRGLRELAASVDTLIVIPNQKLFGLEGKGLLLEQAFSKANEFIAQVIREISKLILTPGLLNVDFAAVKKLLKQCREALVGIGSSKGSRAAVEAATTALSCQLLNKVDWSCVRQMIVNVSGGKKLTLSDVNEAANIIHKVVAPTTDIILGAGINEMMMDSIRITLIVGLERGIRGQMSFVSNMITKLPTLTKEDFLHPRHSRRRFSSIGIEKVLGELPFTSELDIPTFVRQLKDK